MQQVVMLWRIEKKLFCDIIWINSLINDISGSLSSLQLELFLAILLLLLLEIKERRSLLAASQGSLWSKQCH